MLSRVAMEMLQTDLLFLKLRFGRSILNNSHESYIKVMYFMHKLYLTNVALQLFLSLSY